MATLLVMTTGQTDVQLIKEEKRHKLDGNKCGLIHDAISERLWSVDDTPPRDPNRDFITAVPLGEHETSTVVLGVEGKPETIGVEPAGDTQQSFVIQRPIRPLPAGPVRLCTPKLDAVLKYFAPSRPTSVLLLETRRQDERDPRLAGEFMEHRLRSLGVEHVTRVAFLTGKEHLEDRSNDLDAVVRRSVVATLSDAIARATADLKQDDRVFVATTGGLSAANELINELVRLHCVGGPTVTVLEVPDENRAQHDDRAVEEKFHPAAGYRARWHALSLVEKGNLLGAWGAVSHLEGVPGQEWTQVIKWLADFAASMPLPDECDLDVLRHRRMAVRAALRVELALRAGDIPRAVHGTVGFFEAALWDHLGERTSRHGTKQQFKFHEPVPSELVREQDCAKLAALSKRKQQKNRVRPFLFEETTDGVDWYRIDDSMICAVQIAEHYLKLDHLTTLAKKVNEIRQLRNNVAHNEPTPELMEGASERMQNTGLWSSPDTSSLAMRGKRSFLSQPLVQSVLKELGEACPESLLASLLTEVRRRLVAAAPGDGP